MKSLTGFALLGVGVMVGVLLTTTTGAQQAVGLEAPQPLPRNIVIRVGDLRVDAEEVLERINEVEQTLSRDGQHLRHALQHLLNLQLVKAEATRLGITATAEELEAESLKQIEQTKQKVFEAYGNTVPWDQFLSNQNLSEAGFRKLVRSRAEQILLKHRLVRFWELTGNKVQAMQVSLDRKRDADQFLGQIDAYFEDLELVTLWDNEVAEGRDPASHQRLRTWNRDKIESTRKKLDGMGGSKSSIFGHTMAWELNKRNAGRHINIIEGEPIDDRTRELLFKQMTPGTHTGVIQYSPTDYRIFFLNARIEATPQPYATLKPTIDKLENPDEDLFLRWVNSVYNAERYRISTRIPGEEQINVLTRAERKALEEKNRDVKKANEEQATPSDGQDPAKGR